MFKLRPHQQRACDAMAQNVKGTVLIPTGGGKTMCMISNCSDTFQDTTDALIVVVAPRILLAQQLCSEFMEHLTNVSVLHVHSGETHYFSTTNPKQISKWTKYVKGNKIIFTTYHSLHRIQEAEVYVNTIYFDEAHNSVQRQFFPPTEHYSSEGSDKCFFFTATRKTSVTINKPGMNDTEVYGDVICRVSAPELVKGGYIVPPKVSVKKMDMVNDKFIHPNVDCGNVLETIDDQDIKKILVCVKTSKQLINQMSHTDFSQQLKARGYSFLYITSKTGAVVDGKKVNREQFFNTLNTWGKDPAKNFVVLHRSILSEGINVSELEAVIFLRNMSVIEMTQTIGRVVRTGSQSKTFGLCIVPVYSKVGIATEKALQNVVDTVFQKGEMLDSIVRR